VSERNRVTPSGDLVAAPLRGAWTGNRGRLHRGHEIVRFHAGSLWIICALRFHDRWQPQWQPGHYTFLFFHDEAVAFAAGHRPCAECRHADYQAYRRAWAEELGGPAPSAAEINRRLHAERLFPGTHRRRPHPLPWPDLPPGTFVRQDAATLLVRPDRLVEWTPRGYGRSFPRPRTGRAEVLTPPATLAVLRAGYPVQIDPTADRNG
jgi:hypothetical protein